MKDWKSICSHIFAFLAGCLFILGILIGYLQGAVHSIAFAIGVVICFAWADSLSGDRNE